MQLSDRESTRRQQFGPVWRHDLQLLFSDIAAEYDKANAFFSFGLWRRVQQAFTENIEVFDNADVLDVCAGTNAVGIDLLRHNPTLRVTALDRNKDMQDTGARLAVLAGFHIKSVVSDAHALPFETGAFDVVTLKAASRHLEIEKVFSEVYRVLKRGGRFFHCDLIKPSNAVVASVCRNYMRLMLPVTSIKFFRKKHFLSQKEQVFKMGNYFVDAINRFYTADELTRIIREMGFEGVTSKTAMCGLFGIHQGIKK